MSDNAMISFFLGTSCELKTRHAQPCKIQTFVTFANLVLNKTISVQLIYNGQRSDCYFRTLSAEAGYICSR
jgi:hypothetical protein